MQFKKNLEFNSFSWKKWINQEFAEVMNQFCSYRKNLYTVQEKTAISTNFTCEAIKLQSDRKYLSDKK